MQSYGLLLPTAVIARSQILFRFCNVRVATFLTRADSERTSYFPQEAESFNLLCRPIENAVSRLLYDA
jgi:hypothetical protein